MVQQGKKGNDLPNGGTKYREQSATMTSQRKDMGDARGNGMGKADGRSQNGNSGFFRTDTAISGGNRNQGERVLQRWVPDKPADTDGSLEGGRGRVGAWDQFAENERRFGIKTDYDENIYTTQINTNHPHYAQRLAEADRKAREIERSTALNSHVAEERIADHIGSNENGLDEEDKYSGVRRQDFPPLTSSKGAYQPPGKRAPVDRASIDRAPAAAPVATPADRALVDSAIMFAGAKADKPADKVKPAAAAKSTKPEVATPPATTESSTTPELKTSASPSASRTVSPQVKTTGGPNATATVEADVSKAFKNFAANQRNNIQQIRMNKIKNDKQIKLNDLKKFANDFKLNTPVPSDLVSIIAKDPAKQKAIQEKAQRNAEEAKLHPTESVKPMIPNFEGNGAQRSATTTTSHTTSPPSGSSSRQNVNRGPYPQGTHSFTQNSRGDRPAQAQQSMPRSGTAGNLSQRLRNLEQSRPAQVPSNVMPVHEARLPPTGPSNLVDPNFSRRSSGVTSAQGGPRLNANVSEFRPNAFAKDFSPAGNPSSGSSPRSMANAPEAQPTPPVARSLIRRKPLPKGARPSLKGKYDAMELIKTLKPGDGKNWGRNGGLKPAYDTHLLWKLSANDAPTESYVQVFEKAPFPTATPVVSEPHPPQAAPQVPHQHQLPFHLQSGVHNINARQSPRQPPINMHGAQMGHPTPAFSGPDELRMMPSHSAQSFSSPRMQQLPMAFHSPMGANAQLAYNPQMVPYPGAPQIQPFRSLSQNHQFMPQQAHMGQPVMIPNPAGGFMPPQGMAPGPQMMYPPGAQGQFMPPNNGHPPAMPNGGYPSPGRGAPMMMNQGSQQGHPQPIYGMSPGPQYGNVAPVFPQPIPNQSKFSILRNIAIDSNTSIVPMGGGYGAPNQFGTSPQHGGPRNQYNPNAPNYTGYRNFQQRGQHPHGPPNNQVPTGPQAQATGVADES
ncbi:poly(A)-binding protein binding protein [Ciborinia camelliae]|nr:poly(A)-binding protein binding protein [Ciborinia camelliae]